jgi:hypothetical protein
MNESNYIAYMERTRDYYLALGYDNPYEWAHHRETPFTPMSKALGQATIGLITTAAPFRPEFGDQGPGAAYNGAAKFFEVYALPVEGRPDVRISHIAYDRFHTSAEDVDSYFPLARMKDAVEQGRIGAVAKRFVGLPTDRSQQTTVDVYARDILAFCREDGVEAALLVPNCPVCHQSVGLVARHLEANGIPTVVLGCAKDIVEYCGVPRFLFSDFPLGNAAGKPHDRDSQRATVGLALELLATATAPNTTVINPQVWAADDDWKNDYCSIERLSPTELAGLRAKFDEQKSIAKAGK